MIPFLKDGALGLVGKPERIFCADIIVYKYNGQMISHRLVRRLKDIKGNILYQTKADNGYTLDEPVSLKDICGKVVAIKKEDKIVRLDTLLRRLEALYFWCVSVRKVIIHKYVKKRGQA